MKTLKDTQNVHAYLNIFVTTVFVTGWLMLLAAPEPAAAQTNDPKLSQQYYIFDHNIDDTWNITKGSSGTNIAIHSLTGFTTTHEDIVGRYLNPFTEWFDPQQGYASEVAGIIGANSNNGIGIAGIDWYGTMKSYNILRKKQSGDNNSYATFSYNGEDFYLDTGKLDAMVDKAIQDNMDIQLFTFGVPGGKEATIKKYQNVPLSGVNDLVFVPSFSVPDPQNQFWQAAAVLGTSLVEGLYNSFLNNGLKPPSDLELFRQKLWEFTQQPNNGVTLAPAGDISGVQLFDTSIPAIFDNYVVTVAGAEKDPLTEEYSQWANSREGSFVDVSAAAKDIVSLSGTGNSNYTNNFTSTAAAMGITGGVVSLLKAEEPSLTHDDIEEVLKRTAIDLEGPGEDDKTGAGFVDAQAAINFVSTNDIVHNMVGETNIEIISDVEVSSAEINMSSAYLNFTDEPSAVDSWAILRKKTGRVEFDNVFQQAPETWLQMSSSGIDITTILGSGPNDHIYDPYDKTFIITSINDYSFTFEWYYWRVTFIDVLGRNIWGSTTDVPETITLDYTAIGQETSTPVPPAPAAPTNLTITNAGGGGPGGMPQLDWDDNTESHFDHYEFYRQKRRISDGYLFDPVLLSTGSTSSYTDSWLVMGEGNPYEYKYYVFAVNFIGKYSGSSNATQWINANAPMFKTANTQEESKKNVPTEFGISNNYPNPFNPTTTIKFGLPEQADVTLEVFNVLGQKVSTLVNEIREPGFYEVNFDGRNLASGLYIARLQAVGESGKSYVKELKMQMIK